MDIHAAATEADAITVDLDAGRRIERITVGSLPDELRSPDPLAEAVRSAYTRAVADTWERERESVHGTPYRPTEQPVPVATRTPAPVRSSSWGNASDEEIAEFRREHPAQEPGDPLRTYTGISDNQCVEVTLNLTDHFGALTIDQGWLSNAGRSQVQAALNEAFQDAYTRKGSR